MKKAFSSLLLVLTATALMSAVACKKNDDSGGDGGTFAATPTPAPAQNCATAGNPACTPAQPNYYQQNAPQFLNYQWSYSGGYCGCPVGYRPVMNISWGVSCAPDNWFPNSTYYSTYTVQAFYYLPQNGQWTSTQQATYSPAVSGSVNGCGAQVSAICDTRVANSCSGGAVCRPAGGGSYLGLCTTGSGIDNYNYQPAPSSCRYVSNGYYYYYTCGYNGYGSYGIYGNGYSYSYGGMLPR